MTARREQNSVMTAVVPDGTINTISPLLADFAQEILDIVEHAAWLTDALGKPVILNERARTYVSQGYRLLTIPINTNDTYNGKTYRIVRRELNHGTGWFLNEMRFLEDDACAKLRDSTNRLAAALEQPRRAPIKTSPAPINSQNSGLWK